MKGCKMTPGLVLMLAAVGCGGARDEQADVCETGSWQSISAGWTHTCGLTTCGVAYCWGYDYYGQLGDGQAADEVNDGSTNPVKVDTSSISGDRTFAQLSAGGSFTCGLTTDGAAYCWGADKFGQLGDAGESSHSPIPVRVEPSSISGDKTFVQLSAGANHACGLTAEGAAYCWGNDWSGRLGDGQPLEATQRPVAVDVSSIVGEKTFTQLTAGAGHTCGLTTSGVAYCWGSGSSGQLGDGRKSVDAPTPVEVDVSSISGVGTFTQLTAGGMHTCGLTTDEVAYCWGSNLSWQLGSGGEPNDSPIPVEVDVSSLSGGTTFVQLTTGYDHTCGLTTSGVAYCWGSDRFGQLGDAGEFSSSPIPMKVDVSSISGKKTFAQLTAGGGHTCGLATDGTAYCWGGDWYGQLGDGVGLAESHVPAEVDASAIPSGNSFVQLTAGSSFTCGLTREGIAYCWGRDGFGQLGNAGGPHFSQTPKAVDIAPIAR